MEVKPGYKQTEVGVIPEDWEVKKLGAVVEKFVNGGTPSTKNENYWTGNIPWITGADILNQKVAEVRRHITKEAVKCSSTNVIGKGNLLLVSRTGVGKLAIAPFDIAISQDFTGVYVREDTLFAEYLYRYFDFNQAVLQDQNQGTSIKGITRDTLSAIRIPLPPTKAEQLAIAKALGDVDALLDTLEKLIVKKRDLKQAAMQQLLTGQTRLPGFTGEWEVKTLQEITDCFDNVRVPLNEAQREKMRGDYPYCGANGVLDFVNGYVIDDDIILIAEDGGYFDEYAYRPIAYRMIGKCWVNNHAHILKAKGSFDQGFVFYSLVHKNILNFLASGTRAKLNRSEMNKIEVKLPSDEPEQTAISDVLSDMDAEIEALEQQFAKTRALKQGMMQELLTGRVRLI